MPILNTEKKRKTRVTIDTTQRQCMQIPSSSLILALIPVAIIAAIGEVDSLCCLDLRHLTPRTPAEHAEGEHNHDATNEGRRAERFSSPEPVRDGHDEDGQQARYAGKDGARQADQHQEAACESGVHDNTGEEHPSSVTCGQGEGLNASPMEDRQRHPKDCESEGANAGTERVGENHSAARGNAVWRASKALVEDLVQTVEHGADADDQVASQALAGFLLVRRIVVSGTGVAISDNENAGDSDEHSHGLVEAQRLLQQWHREYVGEKRGAVVDCRQVGRRRQVDCDIPAEASNSQSGRHEGCSSDEVQQRRLARERVGACPVQGLILNHDGGAVKQLAVAAPKSRPGNVALLDAQNQQLDGPEYRPRAVGEVEHAVCLIPAELLLNIRRQLGLDNEGEQAQHEEEGSVDVLLTRVGFGC